MYNMHCDAWQAAAVHHAGQEHKIVVSACAMRHRRAHPGVSCNENALRFVPAAYLRALPVYLPVYLLSGLLVHRHALCPHSFLRIWLFCCLNAEKQRSASWAPQALLSVAGCMQPAGQPSSLLCPGS